jgi:hypothetical protein
MVCTTAVLISLLTPVAPPLAGPITAAPVVAPIVSGSVRTSAGCQSDALGASLARRQSTLLRCYERQRDLAPVDTGRIVTRWQLPRSGRPALVQTVGNSTGGGILARCIARRIARTRLSGGGPGCLIQWEVDVKTAGERARERSPHLRRLRDPQPGDRAWRVSMVDRLRVWLPV